MKRQIALRGIICVLTGLVSLGAGGWNALYGQLTTGIILGNVVDQTGSAVPGAEIRLKNVGTGAPHTTKSDAEGRYRVPDLNVGEYEIQIAKMGFSTLVRKNVTLNVGAQVVVDLVMQVGQQQQTVTVEGKCHR